MLRTVSIIVARQLHAIFVARPIAAFRPSPPPLDPAERASPRSYYLSNFFFLFFFSAASADFSAFFTRATKRRKNPIPFCGGRISGRSRYRFAAQQTLLLLLLSTSLDEKIFDFSSLFFSFPISPDSISEWRKNPQDPERSILSPRNREKLAIECSDELLARQIVGRRRRNKVSFGEKSIHDKQLVIYILTYRF